MNPSQFNLQKHLPEKVRHVIIFPTLADIMLSPIYLVQQRYTKETIECFDYATIIHESLVPVKSQLNLLHFFCIYKISDNSN